jgi:hypothetical protein
MTRRLSSIVTLGIALVAVLGGGAVSALSAMGSLSIKDQLSAVLGLLSALILTYVSDRLLILTTVQHEVHDLGTFIKSPTAILRWADATPFDTFVRNASNILIIGLTKAGQLTEGPERLRQIIKTGCRVRIAVLDGTKRPLYDYAALATTHTTDRLMADYNQFILTMKAVRAGLTSRENARLEIRTYPFIPTAATVVAYRGKAVSALTYFYPYKTDPKDRPTILLEQATNAEWLRFFVECHENLWQDVLNHGADPTL